MTSTEETTILRPKARRPFELGESPSDTGASESTTPTREDPAASSEGSFSRTRSILNLTSSTLFGIYSPTAYSGEGSKDDASTPWGTRPVTPSEARSYMKGLGIEDGSNGHGNGKPRVRADAVQSKQSGSRSSNPSTPVMRILKLAVVGVAGAAYGELISFLHAADDTRAAGPLSSPRYMASWGAIAIVFALLLPWLDRVWVGEDDEDERRPRSRGRRTKGEVAPRTWSAPEWIVVVRFIGAFIGISFAIRKIPWQSELQQAATMALVNPAVWYVVDRTLPTLVLSTTTSLAGASLLLSTRPDLIPSPRQLGGHSRFNLTGVSMQAEKTASVDHLGVHDSWAVAIWTASVLFVMCVSFGNIGRHI